MAGEANADEDISKPYVRPHTEWESDIEKVGVVKEGKVEESTIRVQFPSEANIDTSFWRKCVDGATVNDRSGDKGGAIAVDLGAVDRDTRSDIEERGESGVMDGGE